MRIISHGSQRRPNFPSISLSYFTAFFGLDDFHLRRISIHTSDEIVWFFPSNFRQNLTFRGHSSLSSESLNRSEHFPTPSPCLCSVANMLSSMSTEEFCGDPLCPPSRSLIYKQRWQNRQRLRHRPKSPHMHLRT